MNHRRAGADKKRQCAKELTEKGWLVGDVEKSGRMIKVKDLFGLFDLHAVRKGLGRLIEPESLYVQVTRTTPHPHKAIQEWTDMYAAKTTIVEQWVWIARKGWKKYNYKPGEKHKVTETP